MTISGSIFKNNAYTSSHNHGSVKNEYISNHDFSEWLWVNIFFCFFSQHFDLAGESDGDTIL